MPRSAAARWTYAFAFACLALTLAPSAGSAQAELTTGDGMDLHLFRPAVDSKGHFAVNGTDILGHNDFSFGLILDAGIGLLPFRGFANDSEDQPPDGWSPGDPRSQMCEGSINCTNDVVSQTFTGNLMLNYGLFNWAIVGLQVPIAVVNGDPIAVPNPGGAGYYNNEGMTPDSLSYQNVGDVTLHTKVRFTRVEREPVGLAGIVRFQFPSGDAKQFAGEPKFALWPSLVAEARPIPEIRLSLEAGYRFVAGEGSEFPVDGRSEPMVGNSAEMAGLVSGTGDLVQYDDLITYGFGASFRVAEPLDLVAEIYGTQIATEFSAPGASIEAIGGLKIFVDRNSYLMIGGGGGLPPTNGVQRADYRATLGFVFEPSIGDRDGDGYKDDVDQCPDEPEDFDGFEDEDGCPDPDNDRDGILDIDDECPMVPEDKDGDADQDGCPEGNEGDRDGDGLLDDVDECPDDPEDKDEFEDEDGCPDPDNDKDGILDVDDLCPNDPEDKDDFEDADGCPDPDNDKDRILDVDDSCPNDPETYNGHEDEDGCPDRGSVVIEENQIVILEKIYFETDSAVIKQESYSILDAVAATLNGNPQITLIEIQGHADERASDQYNIKLTRDRAAAVLEALVERGVNRNRIRSAGYGERCPVDPKSNPEAWEKNRRVEFKIIETEAGPTGVEVACPAGQELIPD